MYYGKRDGDAKLNRIIALAVTRRALAGCLAIAAAALLGALIVAGRAQAQTDVPPAANNETPMFTISKSIPEDWPVGQASDIILSFEAFDPDRGALRFSLNDTPDAAKFEIADGGQNDAGNYVSHLKLKPNERLDYETQDLHIIQVLATDDSDASTRLQIRLKITDVDEPIDCLERLEGRNLIRESWDARCQSEKSTPHGSSVRYSRFYTFTLDEATDVAVTLTSDDADTYLYLMKGHGTNGDIEFENDDFLGSGGSRIEVRPLAAGKYTIEATTYYGEKLGDFTLVVEVGTVAPLPSPSPAPTPGVGTPSPTAEPTPSPFCEHSIEDDGEIVGFWTSDCESEKPTPHGDANRYARFYTFTLEEASRVTIALTSDAQDAFLYLMKGHGRNGEVQAENDNYGGGDNSQIEIDLEPGDYTIEATTFYAEKSGRFVLTVSGLTPPPLAPRECEAGIAVPDPSAEPGLVSDCETLLEAQDELAGSASLNWSSDVAMDQWDGVTLGGWPKRVTRLELDGKGLNGSIPSELGALSGLTRLSLSGNGLRGQIPVELAGLTRIEELSLSGNRLNGNMPSDFGRLLRLKKLSLSNNQLDGEIPPELGNLANLQELSLSGNDLSGEIPSEFGSLARLRKLLLRDNALSGNIPVELTTFRGLAELRLAGNRLSGCIPAGLRSVAANDLSELGLLDCVTGVCANGVVVENPNDNRELTEDCEALLAARNNLAGAGNLNWSPNVAIDAWDGVTVGGSPKRVTHLILNDKGLTGWIPSGLGRLDGLTLLVLTDNDLIGQIPPAIGNLSDLQILLLARNRLSGDIPPALGDLSKLKILDLSDNRLGGEIPPELSSLSNLETLRLTDNRLVGAIPDAFTNGSTKLDNLKTLSLDGNKLSGQIPANLDNLSVLETLALDDNQLSGAIPKELGRLSNLGILSLSQNHLTGEIPPELGAIPNLRILRLSGNSLSGCIPANLANVPNNDLVALGMEFCGIGNCFGGQAVANPYANLGLASDCAVLLSVLGTDEGGEGKLRKYATSPKLNWSADVPIGNWDGVVVSGSPKRVTELNLNSKGLDGVIPPELGNLTKLKVLKLDNNRLSGEIPTELDRLANLEALSLANNLLTGQVPHELTRLAKLKQLYLSGNDALAGCVPDALRDVERNDFDNLGLQFCDEVDCSTGTTVEQPDENPALVGDCDALLALRDKLAGSAYLNWSPHISISDWDGVEVAGSPKRVTMLDLSRIADSESEEEALDGALPPELGRLTGLETLSLSNNRLSGQIPIELSGLSNLRKLLLDDNLLSGMMPSELGALKDLNELKLSGNGLSGCVPESWRDVPVSDLDELGLAFCVTGECSNGTVIEEPDDNLGLVADCATLLSVRDRLKGDDGYLNWSADVSIEDWIGVVVGGSPKRVIRLNIGRLDLSGEIPPELSKLSKLEELSMSGNRLSGGIPSELGSLSNLEDLSLSRNRLSGAIPSELGRLSKLQYLYLSDNSLDGAIPSELGKLTALKSMSLSENELSGAIPIELGNLSSLQYLYLNNNQLSGAIPSELGNLSALRYLHLTRNQLDGAIPPEIGDLTALRYLRLFDNRLTGNIPAELGNLSNLQELYLSKNLLSGAIPSELGSLSKLTQLYLFGNDLSGCVPDGLRDVQYSDLPLLNLPFCDAGTSMIMIPGGLRTLVEGSWLQLQGNPFLRREI